MVGGSVGVRAADHVGGAAAVHGDPVGALVLAAADVAGIDQPTPVWLHLRHEAIAAAPERGTRATGGREAVRCDVGERLADHVHRAVAHAAGFNGHALPR